MFNFDHIITLSLAQCSDGNKTVSTLINVLLHMTSYLHLYLGFFYDAIMTAHLAEWLNVLLKNNITQVSQPNFILFH